MLRRSILPIAVLAGLEACSAFAPISLGGLTRASIPNVRAISGLRGGASIAQTSMAAVGKCFAQQNSSPRDKQDMHALNQSQCHMCTNKHGIRGHMASSATTVNATPKEVTQKKSDQQA